MIVAMSLFLILIVFGVVGMAFRSDETAFAASPTDAATARSVQEWVRFSGSRSAVSWATE